MTTTQFDPVLTPAPVARILPRLVADTRYVLSGFPAAMAAVLVCVTGLVVGLGLAVIGVGVPLLIFALMQARGFAAIERERIAEVLGHEIREPVYRAASGPGLPTRLLAVLTDVQTWRDQAHASLRFLPNAVSFSLVAVWWAAIVGGLSRVLWGWALPDGPGGAELPELLGLGDAYLTDVTFYLALAVPFALTLPAVTRWAARFEARFAEKLLAGR